MGKEWISHKICKRNVGLIKCLPYVNAISEEHIKKNRFKEIFEVIITEAFKITQDINQ